jgi:hypothetical protein
MEVVWRHKEHVDTATEVVWRHKEHVDTAIKSILFKPLSDFGHHSAPMYATHKNWFVFYAMPQKRENPFYAI